LPLLLFFKISLTLQQIGEAISKNPGYLKLKKIRAAQNIARTIAASKNRVYINAGTLMLNINDKEFDENLESQLARGKKK